MANADGASHAFSPLAEAHAAPIMIEEPSYPVGLADEEPDAGVNRRRWIGVVAIVAALWVILIRGFGMSTIDGAPIEIPKKEGGRGIGPLVGGTIFGLGWALLGACPGPIYALIGSGMASHQGRPDRRHVIPQPSCLS